MRLGGLIEVRCCERSPVPRAHRVTDRRRAPRCRVGGEACTRMLQTSHCRRGRRLRSCGWPRSCRRARRSASSARSTSRPRQQPSLRGCLGDRSSRCWPTLRRAASGQALPGYLRTTRENGRAVSASSVVPTPACSVGCCAATATRMPARHRPRGGRRSSRQQTVRLDCRSCQVRSHSLRRLCRRIVGAARCPRDVRRAGGTGADVRDHVFATPTSHPPRPSLLPVVQESA